MTRFIQYTLIVLFVLTSGWVRANEKVIEPISIEEHISELISEIKEIKSEYALTVSNIQWELATINKKLKMTTLPLEQLQLLVVKDNLKEQLSVLSLNASTKISKVRYIKGLQIIKILYEKNLALDHHFASVSTFSDINNISNPNNYAEFSEVKSLIKTKTDRKAGFDLSNILGNNIYTSVIHSFVSLFNTDNSSKKEKEASLKQVECILDFTLRMHNDLNTIYFETSFLQKSNENIMTELQRLFEDYTKPISYEKSLVECRETDDWASVRGQLNEYLEKLDSAVNDDNMRQKAVSMQINLEFPIDRLLQFITQYNAFIDQGEKFYQKFGIMLNSYENESQCASKIPVEYSKLKESINITIDKFNTAYKPVEINGSKMKEILYGINEYE